MNKLFVLVFIGFLGLSTASWQNAPQSLNINPTSRFSQMNTFQAGSFAPRTAFGNDPELVMPEIPFPECVTNANAAALLSPESINQLFLNELQLQESKLKQERNRNNQIQHNDILDFEARQLRSDSSNGALVARTAVVLSSNLLKQLRCVTNSSLTEMLDHFLKQIPIPTNLCAFDTNPSCAGFTKYRTITGVCNNLQRPYEGSSQTAFGRLLPAVYDDGIAAPRIRSVFGSLLPSCRDISLTMGSRPAFDTSFNNMFVTFGQFLVHDITFATPVTDTGRSPITSCKCDSKDTNVCLVIDIPQNDPFMPGQHCMSTPASAAAFTDSTCTLGVKEQKNSDSHYIDLSATYGSTRRTSHGLRVGDAGALKVSKQPWAKFDLLPIQREGKSCVDSTATEKCFAAGDSRLMENLLLSGIQAQWVRAHNIFSDQLSQFRPDWNHDDDIVYEETKRILAALNQRYVYEEWLPILLGSEACQQYFGPPGGLSQYDPNMPGIMFNEVATGPLRLHSLVRDLLTRCKPNGEVTDQVWLRDISAKCRLAYDGEHNGMDGFLCGSLYDYGFAGDANFAMELHHRLFETNKKGKITRNDLVAINICRGREHGIPSYNAYRPLCGLRRATRFEDFADTLPMDAIQKLASIYAHPDDVDLFVGTTFEIPLSGAIVGTIGACLLGVQFRHLKYGDRFFYTHQGEFTPAQLQSIRSYNLNCFVCQTTDIESVPRNPFRPPSASNPLIPCSQCPSFDFQPWLNGGFNMG